MKKSIVLAIGCLFHAIFPGKDEQVLGPGTDGLKLVVYHPRWSCGITPEGEIILCNNNPAGVYAMIKRSDGDEYRLYNARAYHEALKKLSNKE